MSSTNRGINRIVADKYYTPLNCVTAILDRMNVPLITTFCEPCVGIGTIRNAVRERAPHARFIDFEIDMERDYLERSLELPNVDLIVTNPPFLKRIAFMERSLIHGRTVAYLIALNHLGPKESYSFWSTHPPTHQYTMTWRPSFVDVCKGFQKTTKRAKQKGCGFNFYKFENMKRCPNCAGAVSAGTDSDNYAWVVWDRWGFMKDKPGLHWLLKPAKEEEK